MEQSYTNHTNEPNLTHGHNMGNHPFKKMVQHDANDWEKDITNLFVTSKKSRICRWVKSQVGPLFLGQPRDSPSGFPQWSRSDPPMRNVPKTYQTRWEFPRVFSQRWNAVGSIATWWFCPTWWWCWNLARWFVEIHPSRLTTGSPIKSHPFITENHLNQTLRELCSSR